jgi:hypothetical protein
VTILQAVNEILAGLGEPPVTVLDTGGTSEAAEAETYIDNAMREIILEGWPQTADENREVPLPTFRLTVNGSATAFVWGETVTIGSVEVIFSHFELVGATLYMFVSGATTPGTGTATGGTSGLTKTVSAVTALSTSKIGVGSDWTAIRAGTREYKRITVRDGFLFDLDDLTTAFTGNVFLDIKRDGSFDELTDALQNYIVKKAAMLFQRYKKRGVTDDQFLRDRLIEARGMALRERQDHARTNIHRTSEANAISGDRLWYPIPTGA